MSISASSSPMLKPIIANMFGINKNQKIIIIEKNKDIFEYSDSFETSNETSNEIFNELLDFELERELECEKELDILPISKTKTKPAPAPAPAHLIIEIPPESYFAVADYLMKKSLDTKQSPS